MVSAINSALSGLNFASKQLDVAANNIANDQSSLKNTNGTITDSAYSPQQVVGVSQADGGVTPIVENAYPSQQQANNANQQNQGNDITKDLVNTNIASYDFQANLKVIQTQDKTVQSFLNIIS